MVIKLKPTVGPSKGILVFTHKERFLFLANTREIRQVIERVKRNYVFLMHWGMHLEDMPHVPFIDAHLAGKKVVSFKDQEKIRRIDLCSRNFLPDFFRPLKVTKQWDLLVVTRPVKRKNNMDVVKTVRSLYDDGVKARVLMICPLPDNLKGNRTDVEFLEKYDQWFNIEEKGRFQLLTPNYRHSLFPIPRESLPLFYGSARVVGHFSTHEGQPKILAEALLCGTPVLVRESMRGDGEAFLTKENSRKFNSVEEAKQRLLQMWADPLEFDTKSLRKKVVSIHTRKDFEEELRQLYGDLAMPYKGELITGDLSSLLPSHVPDLPESLRYGKTNDLRSAKALLIYLYMIEGSKPPFLSGAKTTMKTNANKAMKIPNSYLTKVGRVAGKIFRTPNGYGP